MQLPLGFNTPSPNKVCKLRKWLYGLHQAPRQWFAKLSAKLSDYGFVRSYVGYSLFNYRKGSTLVALLAYIDDIILADNDSHICKEFKVYLNLSFRIKDLGPLKYFQGIEVPKDLLIYLMPG